MRSGQNRTSILSFETISSKGTMLTPQPSQAKDYLMRGRKKTDPAPSGLEPTINGLTRAHLEAQLRSALERRCWFAEDAIRADLRQLDRGET